MRKSPFYDDMLDACESSDYGLCDVNFDKLWELAIRHDALEKKLATAREALEFYANKANWREHNSSNRPAGMTYSQRITSRDSSSPDGSYNFCGGSKARSTLKSIDGEGE